MKTDVTIIKENLNKSATNNVQIKGIINGYNGPNITRQSYYTVHITTTNYILTYVSCK